MVFLLAAVARYVRDDRRIGPASKAWLLIAVCSLILVGLWHFLLQGAGMIPEPRAICSFPLR